MVFFGKRYLVELLSNPGFSQIILRRIPIEKTVGFEGAFCIMELFHLWMVNCETVLPKLRERAAEAVMAAAGHGHFGLPQRLAGSRTWPP